MPLAASAPTVAKDAWVAPSATLIGEVDVSDGASVWYGAVIRGERRVLYRFPPWLRVSLLILILGLLFFDDRG